MPRPVPNRRIRPRDKLPLKPRTERATETPKRVSVEILPPPESDIPDNAGTEKKTRCTVMKRILMKQNRVIESLKANGGHIQNACEKANISRTTFYEWKERYKGFADQVDQIIAGQIDTMESALFRAGLEGNVTAQIFYLKNKRPEEWQDVSRIDARVGVVDVRATKAEIAAIIEKYGLLSRP